MAFVLALLLLQAPQLPARDRAVAEAAGTGVIAGRVVDAETGEPIEDALVRLGTLTRPTEMPRRQTDARGGFRYEGLPPGDYILAVEPPEHHATHVMQILNSDIAGIMTGRVKPSVKLQAGGVREDVVVRLDRALAIDGRVVDETGQVMGEMQVIAEPTDAAATPFGRGAIAYSDDRGQFRLFGLAVGAYRVCATPFGFGRMSAPAGAGDTAPQRYVKTCYPSAPEGGGERVTLDRRGAPMLTIVMQRVRSYTISGRVTSESAAKNILVQAQRRGLDGNSMSVAVELKGDRFVARNVPPGEYTITARAGEDREEGSRFQGAERAIAHVRVEASDITGVDLVTTKGPTLRGRVVPDAPLPAGTKLRVQQAPTVRIFDFLESWSSKPVQEDLTFELTGIHGPVLVDVAGLPDGWVLTHVRYRGTDVTHAPTSVTTTADPTEFEIGVSPRSARLLVRAVNAQGEDTIGALVLLLPAQGERLYMQQLMMDGPPKVVDGAIEMPALAPGDYVAVALAFGDVMALMKDAAQIADLRRAGQPVTLKAGERRKIDVVVRPLSEVRR